MEVFGSPDERFVSKVQDVGDSMCENPQKIPKFFGTAGARVVSAAGAGLAEEETIGAEAVEAEQ